MATIANLDINLKANVSKYNKDMKQAGNSTQSFAKTVRNAAVGTGSFTSTLTSLATKGAVITTMFAGIGIGVNKIVQGSAQTADAIEKAAKSAQISAADFQSLSFAFEQNGSNAEELTAAFEAVGDRYVDLQDGSASMISMFNRMGVSLSDLEGLDTADQFRLIATSINNIEDPLERVGVASKVFGGVGKTVLNLADNLGTAENRFNELGLTIDDAAIARGVKLKNLNNELSRSWDKLTSQMSGLFGPVIEGWTMMLSDFAEKISEAAGGALLFAENLGLVARNQAAINGATDAEFRNFMENQQRSNRSRIVRKRLKVDDGKGGEQFLIDKQIASQRQLIEALKNQSNKLAPIPQALLKGSSAQIDFVAQLQRQNQQAKIDQREKKKIDIAEKQLKKLEEIKKQRDEEFKDRKTISIL